MRSREVFPQVEPLLAIAGAALFEVLRAEALVASIVIAGAWMRFSSALYGLVSCLVALEIRICLAKLRTGLNHAIPLLHLRRQAK